MCPVVGIVGWTGLVSLSLCFLSLSLSLCPSFLSVSISVSVSLYLSPSLSLYISRSLSLSLSFSLAAYSGADPAADHHSFEVCGLAPGFPQGLERRRDVGE